jgi:hypothetical protein
MHSSFRPITYLLFFLCFQPFVYTMEKENTKQDIQPAAPEEQESNETAEEATCPICLGEYRAHERGNEPITLSCGHTTHKSCLETFYKSLVLVNSNQALTCVICRRPLIDNDRLRLDLEITMDDRYQSMTHTILNNLDNPYLALLSLQLHGILASETTLEVFTELLEQREAAVALLDDFIRLLPLLTRENIQSGELQRRIGALSPLSQGDFGSFLQILVHRGYLNPEYIATIRTMLQQRDFTNHIAPVMGPLLNVLRLFLHHIDSGQEPEIDNPELDRLLGLLKKLEIIIIRRLLNPTIDSINELAPLSAMTATRFLGTAFVLEGFAILISTMFDQLSGTEPMQIAINRPFPLRLNQPNLHRTAHVLRDMLHNALTDETGSHIPRTEGIHLLVEYNPELVRRLDRLPLDILVAQRDFLNTHIARLHPTFYVRYRTETTLLGVLFLFATLQLISTVFS